jgi:hypothetical protein
MALAANIFLRSGPEVFLDTEPERIGTGFNGFEWVKFKEYCLPGQILFVYSRPFQNWCLQF